jgi:NAD(P)-dependent dehydrogenase (short-subunit alcohol dehydrogenase family)
MEALVIGGGSGIGAAVAQRQKANSLRVAVWDRQGPRDITCDISHPEQINSAVAGLEVGALPSLITITAGVGHSGLLVDVSPEEWDQVMAINTRGPWLCMRALATALMATGQSASMVATSSVSAHLVDSNMGLYCASKAALSMLVKVAASEWGPAGIRVNAIAPGVTATPMLRAPEDSPWLVGVAERTAQQRIGTADDIAGAIVALHEMTWVTGQVIDCDGGLSLHSPIDAYNEIERMRKGHPR